MANLQDNLLNTPLTAAEEGTINTSLSTALTTLEPRTYGLTEDQLKSLFSLQEENLVFAVLAKQQAEALSSLIPPAISSVVTNLTNDLDLYSQMVQIDNVLLAQIKVRVEHTRRLAGHEAYVGSLAVYKIIEALAAMGIPQAVAAYNLLKERFANQGGTKPADPDTP